MKFFNKTTLSRTNTEWS